MIQASCWLSSKADGPTVKDPAHISAGSRQNRFVPQARLSAKAGASGLERKPVCSHAELLPICQKPQKASMNTRSRQHKHGNPGADETAEDVPDLVELPVNPDEATPLLPDDDGVVQVPT